MNSRERPVIPMRRSFSEFRNREVLPFYMVCDESESMGPIGGITALNQALPDIHAEIASNPLVAEICLISLITFADTAEELMQLTKLSDVDAMPGMQARGACKYGPAFTLLREIIHRDVADLKYHSVKVFRPAVFFMTAGEPTDDPDWEIAYRSLMDWTNFRNLPNTTNYPQIIAFGVNEANPSVIGKIGTVGAFIGDNGVTPAAALSNIFNSLTSSWDPHHFG